ncbi:hypothetical protein HU200_005470 [Digitaria exilis]|uniref:Uncharacterized protein n=1 Tax=Digitaria exilis TaxID=1010633 RepID=A0A835FSN9_9POAL|nr:hypothetical protein HU200_005470 [Digitaria exilis]
MTVELQRYLHMVAGEGENSYAQNSRLQEKAMVEVRPVLEKVVTDVYTALSPRTMVVADLGCSSGPNTLHFVSDVIRVTGDCCSRACRDPPELQFFLNDMPGNDFNSLFRSLDAQRKKTAASMPPHYVVGLPGSFYTRLFPERSVHFFHSSYSLMWLSQLPKELQVNSKIHLNEGNIYLRTTTSPSVVKMYQEQFQKDFLLFLKLRSKELVFGGQMLLSFLGRKNNNVFDGDLNHVYGLLGQALQSLVLEGIVEKARLDSFNLPIYGPSIDEVVAAVKQSEVYDINHIQLFESNWDPYDDSEGDFVGDTVQSGINVSKCLRAVMEPLLVRHFGEYILDELFERYAFNVAKHLEREKTRYSVIVVSLRSKP